MSSRCTSSPVGKIQILDFYHFPLSLSGWKTLTQVNTITHSFLSLHLVVVVLGVVRTGKIVCCVKSGVWAGAAGAGVGVIGALIGAGVSCTFPDKKSLRGFGSSGLIMKGVAGAGLGLTGAWEWACFSGTLALTGFITKPLAGVSPTVLT